MRSSAIPSSPPHSSTGSSTTPSSFRSKGLATVCAHTDLIPEHKRIHNTAARSKAPRPTAEKGETDRNIRLITDTRKLGNLLRHFWGFLKRPLQPSLILQFMGQSIPVGGPISGRYSILISVRTLSHRSTNLQGRNVLMRLGTFRRGRASQGRRRYAKVFFEGRVER